MSGDARDRRWLSPDEWRAVEPLLDQALARPADQRFAFVAEACRGNDALESLVVQCLEEHEQPDALLDGSAPDVFASLIADDDVREMPSIVLAGRYRIEREIGRGGMATVYLARDLTHERNVAVKVLNATGNAALGNDVERFLTEIRLTAKLQHPHIVPLYDSGETEGCVFFVMPYCEGETLHERIVRQGRLPVAEAVRIGLDVASALEHAHSLGIVHRDVKPSNLLLVSGQVLLVDFGIARLITSAVKLTQVGVIMGTPAYMSPEQASGIGPVGEQTDIYSLGCVLYEMLSGEIPSSAPTRESLARHSIDPVPSLRVIRDDVPAALEQCVARSMAMAPKDRFASARDLSCALSECARDVQEDVRGIAAPL